MVDCLSMIRRAILALPLGALALLAALPMAGAMAQTPDPEGPVLVYQNIKDGDTIDRAGFRIQLCFAEPVNIKDLDKGGDFAFQVTQPDGIGLGHRDVFQPDGYGVAVYPGNPVGETAGEWTFNYRVTTPGRTACDDGHDQVHGRSGRGSRSRARRHRLALPLAARRRFRPVTAPSPTPTAPMSSARRASDRHERTPTPTLKPGSPTPIVTRGPVEEEDDDDGPDILKLALITVGVAGGAALLALIGYFVRRRVGYEPHKPKPGDGDGGHH